MVSLGISEPLKMLVFIFCRCHLITRTMPTSTVIKHLLQTIRDCQVDEYIGRITAVFKVLATHDIGMQRAELGEDICSLPVESAIYFVSSHSVVTIIRILSQSQGTLRHKLWSYIFKK